MNPEEEMIEINFSKPNRQEYSTANEQYILEIIYSHRKHGDFNWMTDKELFEMYNEAFRRIIN